jgi:hypothetical protein
MSHGAGKITQNIINIIGAAYLDINCINNSKPSIQLKFAADKNELCSLICGFM